MKVELLQQYVQINISRYSEFLPRAISFAMRHFSRSYRLSSSILILDDGERLKKDYFLNWAYHIGLQRESREESASFEEILAHSYLPIRIKIIDETGVLEQIKISLKVIKLGQVALILDHPNLLARRYLLSIFKNFLLSYNSKELFLNAESEDFWEVLLGLISQKIIHNVVLNFDYESFKACARGGFENSGFKEYYLTKDEITLRNSLKTLSCNLNDDWETIKNRYIELAREYHPDRVYGQDIAIVESYTEKFRDIQAAYENLKRQLEVRH
ncbi:molecular chaperone [Helicobacter monodelphidis]|nr:molecular chaperone [Helicobacter sp. 15-1451]